MKKIRKKNSYFNAVNSEFTNATQILTYQIGPCYIEKLIQVINESFKDLRLTLFYVLQNAYGKSSKSYKKYSSKVDSL